MQGEPTWVTARCSSVDGKPIPGATIDVWQAKADGIYDIQDPKAEFELRGRREDQRRRAIRLPHASSPSSTACRPTARWAILMRAMKRHPMRPAHMHAIVSAPGYRRSSPMFSSTATRTSTSDAVFAVKDSLIAQVSRRSTRRTRRRSSACRRPSPGSNSTSGSRLRRPTRRGKRSRRPTPRSASPSPGESHVSKPQDPSRLPASQPRQQGRVGNPRRSRRGLPARRTLQVDRPHLHALLGARAGHGRHSSSTRTG